MNLNTNRELRTVPAPVRGRGRAASVAARRAARVPPRAPARPVPMSANRKKRGLRAARRDVSRESAVGLAAKTVGAHTHRSRCTSTSRSEENHAPLKSPYMWCCHQLLPPPAPACVRCEKNPANANAHDCASEPNRTELRSDQISSAREQHNSGFGARGQHCTLIRL